LDGSGAGCSGTTASSTTSVVLGTYAPTGAQTFVLNLLQGEQVAETLNALNYGSASSLKVSGLKISQTQVTNLNNYILSLGASSSGGSVDQLFSAVQAGTTLASGATPAFVVSLSSATASTTILQTTVANNLVNTVTSGLGGAPTSISIPAGTIKFSLSTSIYTSPLSTTPTATSVSTSAKFLYYGSGGTGTDLDSANASQIIAGTGATTATLTSLTNTFTYSVPATGNTLTRVVSGTANNGDTYTQADTTTVAYAAGGISDNLTSYTKTYTSGTKSGSVFQTGTSVSGTLTLTALTQTMVAGRTVTLNNECGTNNDQANVLTFSSDGSSVTQTCGGTNTIAASPIPGIILVTNSSSGTIEYVGLQGSGLVAGANFIVIREDAGHAGWSKAAIASVQ
jgi:hypothetical protein